MAKKKPSSAANREPFSTACVRCPRLATHLAEVRTEYPDYHGRPVVPFGDIKPKLLIVGLAPGMHGANRTGRPFTGDYAGVLLYDTLYRYGFGSQSEAIAADDGLVLKGCRITNAVKCLPPGNKPLPAEIRECNAYLRAELEALAPGTAILALGTIAHQSVLRAMDRRLADVPFAHGASHDLGNRIRLFDSYHCSRYNTNTRRLTAAMFHEVFAAIREYTDRVAVAA